MGMLHSIVVWLFMFLAASSCGLIVVVGVMQSEHKEKTPLSVIYVDGAKSGDPCTDVKVLLDSRPLRFSLEGDPHYMQCGWNTKNDLMRMPTGILGLGVIALGMYSLVKRKRWLLYLISITTFIGGIAFLGAMILDSNAVRIGSAFCKNGLPGVDVQAANVSKPAILCHQFPFVFTCLVDAATAVIWLSLSLLSFQHARSHMSVQSVHEMLGEDSPYDSLISHDDRGSH